MCIKLKRLQEGRGIEVVSDELFTGRDWVNVFQEILKMTPPAYLIYNFTKTRCFGFTGAELLSAFSINGPLISDGIMKHIAVFPSHEQMADVVDMVTTLVQPPDCDMGNHKDLVMDFPEAIRWLANKGAFED